MEEDGQKSCFVIMPISDTQGYDKGHFKRVYEFIIKPACIKAGFKPLRADDIKKTNVIVIDILQKLISSDMAICDLSARNPNVLYELGIRQAFDLPVSFIKDEITERIFDIQGFRDIEYKSSLRIDEVNAAIDSISESLADTYQSKGSDINSIIELLGITKAKAPEKIEVSPETDLILAALNNLGSRISDLEEHIRPNRLELNNEYIVVSDQDQLYDSFQDIKNQVVFEGNSVIHPKFGEGQVLKINKRGNTIIAEIKFKEGSKRLLPRMANLLKKD